MRLGRSLSVGSFACVCSLALGTSALAAPPQDPRADERKDIPRQTYLLWADGGGAVVSADRDRRCVEGPRFERQCWSDTAGRPRLLAGAVGERIVAALVDEAGALWRYDGETWTASALAPETVASLVGLTVSADGQVFASSESTLFVWDGERWDRHEIPAPLRGGELALAASPGGRLYLGRRGDTVWTFNGRTFDRVIYGGINADAMTSDVDDLAYQASANALWLVTRSGVLGRIDLDTGAVSDWRLPASVGESEAPGDEPRRAWRIFGYEKPGGYEVFLAHGASTYSQELDRVVWRGDADEQVEWIWPESGGRRLVLITSGGRRQEVDGTIRRENVSYTLSPVEEKRIERAAQRRPPPPMLREGRLVPDLGVRFGAAIDLGGDRAASFFRFEASLGMLIAPVAPSPSGVAFWIWPRAGTKIDTNTSVSTPGLFGDVGLGVGNSLVMGAAHVGALVAFQGGASSAGVRYSGGLYSVWGTVGIEAHLEEIAPASARARSVAILLSLNLAPVLWLASVLSER